MKKGKVAILIPAINEEKVIAHTLKAAVKIVENEDVYVIDDGSTDNTSQVAKKYTQNVKKTKNHGKAHAMNFGIKYFSLIKNYEFIFFIDADTKPNLNFLKVVMPHFNKDSKKTLACVIGRVKGMGHNWISRYRQWEYFIAHYIHKKAQENLRSILVAPGCATVYRSSVFKKLKFPKGTLTEDMDFTFLMHRRGYDQMIFEDKAIVNTQDPQNLIDFIKQIKRWYTGFWQVVRKHNIPWEGQALDLEVAMLALEGLYNGLIVVFFMLSIVPLILLHHINVYTIPLSIDLVFFFTPTLIWSSLVDKDYKRIYYLPAFYILRFLSSIIFIVCFFKGFLSKEKEYAWDSQRYLQERLY